MVNTKSKTTTTRILVAAVAMSLLAAACGSDDTEQTVAPSTTTSTTTTGAPVSTEHPCDTGTAWKEAKWCLADDQWWAQDGTGTWVASDGPPATTTTVAAMTEEEIVEIQQEIAEVVEDASPEDIPPAEVAELVIEAAEEAAPESELTLGICTQWVADPELILNEQQAQECAAMLAAAVEACEGLDCFGDDGTEPESELEPEETPTTTAPPEPESEEPTTTSVPSQPEPEPEPEAEEPTASTTPPEPEPEDTQPEYVVGDVVAASELYPDQDLPSSLFCEIQADSGPLCWTEPTELANPSNEGWVPPEAGMVPEPHPECSSDDLSTWDQTCNPPSSWDSGEFVIGSRVDETPRLSAVVLNFLLGCKATLYAPCDWLLGLMQRPLDYLGARPTCVLGEYLDRVDVFARIGNTSGAHANQYGWHNCATVIDPLVGEVPEHRNDVGARLSDTGLSLAERCRVVLPEDIMLETFYGGLRSDGTRRDPIRFDPGHAGCDDWAEWVNAVIEHRSSDMPDCYPSARLAEEWMEHHHGIHEGYITGSC